MVIGSHRLRPVFRFDTSLSGQFLFVAITAFFVAASFATYPIAVSGIIVWGGSGTALAISLIVLRKKSLRTVLFYYDHIEVHEGATSSYSYSDVTKLNASEYSSRVLLLGARGRERPIPLVGKPKSTYHEEFLPWLLQRLEGSATEVNLSHSGGDWSSNPIAPAILVGLSLYVGLFFGLLVLLRPQPSDLLWTLLGGLPILPAVAGFVVVARHYYGVREPSSEPDSGSSARVGVESQQRGVARELITNPAKLVPLILALLVLGTFVIVAVPFLPGEDSYYLGTWNQVSSQLSGQPPLTDFAAIFSNNLRGALLDFVPGMGPFFEAGATYNTARTMAAAALNHEISPFYYASRVFSFPHSWLELTAYALAVYESLRLSFALGFVVSQLGHREVRFLVGDFGVAFGLVASTLAIAALLETVEPLMVNPYLLWIPVVVGGALITIFFRRHTSVFTWPRPFDR